MSTEAQQIFKRIVVHNKLLGDEEVDTLLERVPEPEQAVRWMVAQRGLPAKTGKQLLAVYQKKLGKAASDSMPSVGKEPATASQDQGASTVQSGATEKKEAPTAKAKPKPAPAPAAGQLRDLDPKGEPVYAILRAARAAGASDVHIKVGEPAVMRVIGSLKTLDVPPLTAEGGEEALLALLDDEKKEHFLAHNDLDFSFDSGEEELGRFRVNFLRHYRGMDGIFRLINSKVPSFDELGMPDVVKKFTEYRQGIVLITGPKGCGKTTTLAAMVDLINRSRPDHVITIEDPIEYVQLCNVAHMNQREVGPHTKTFSNALRAAMREAPDVILVGEMRDLETTSLAITAAETGHLVFSTLHTPDAIRTIGRVLAVFPPKEQGQIRSMRAESLRGIVSQTLIPNIDGTKMELAYEILVNTSACGNLIRDDRSFQLPSILQTGKKQGMCLMDESIAQLARAGKISKEEALSRAANVQFMRDAVAKI
ncbi:MAG: PilT/PilU family type 4a pilus ATPase [Pirellulales bacterium]|nr:PilT/PilU family type 4a pilus ATPase [Pirellulales bacterium]